MIDKCKLQLMDGEKNFEVILHRWQLPPNIYQWDMMAKGFLMWGKYVMPDAADGTRVGNLSPEKRFWVYSPTEMELTFIDAGGPGYGMVGGGLQFGQLAPVGVSARLLWARPTNRIIEPTGNVGPASMYIPSHFGCNFGVKDRVTWRLSGIPAAASSHDNWQEP